MQVLRRKTKDPLSYLDSDQDSKSKVKDFLDSKARNSQKTSNAYSFGLKHFSNFLDSEYGHLVTIGNIIDKIKTNEIDLYMVINKFVSYLIAIGKLTNRTVKSYPAHIRTYLQFYDVDIIPQKWKNRVPMPKEYHEEEQAIDHEDIREILKACTNRRLKTYLYVLASGGMRANEALALRLKDIDFTELPTKVHIRKENKTKRPRDIFISDEATKYLKQWLDHKYGRRRIRTKMVTHEKSDNDLIFTLEFDDSIKPTSIYPRIMEEFHKVLKTVNLNEIKEGSYSSRRKITLNSFRRFVYSTISDYKPLFAEWVLGHNKTPYWTFKPQVKREEYVNCMKALTFLDFSGLVSSAKNQDARLDAKDKEIRILTEANKKHEEEILRLRSSTTLEMNDLRKITNEINQKFENFEGGVRSIQNSEHQLDALYQFSNTFDIGLIPFSLLGNVLLRVSEYPTEEIYQKIEREMIKRGILKGNILDLKKLSYFDPKGEMLEALTKTKMIKNYKIKS